MEQLIGIDPTLFLGRYWSTFSSSISDVYVISVVVCFVVSILTIGYTSKSRNVKNFGNKKGSKSGKKKNTDDKIRQGKYLIRSVLNQFHDSSIPPRKWVKSSESVPKPEKV